MAQSRFALITFLDGPYPDNSLPGPQPGVPPPLFPTNPIAPGGTTPPWGINSDRPSHPIYYPPGIWGPNDPRPGTGLPGDQPGVGYPGFPTPPIYITDGEGSVSVRPPAVGVPQEGTLTFYGGKGYVFVPKSESEAPDAEPKS